MSKNQLEKHGPAGKARQTEAARILEQRQQNKQSKKPPTSKKFPDKGPRKKK